MAQFVEKQIEKVVKVMTSEGRIFVGVLKSFDQRMNVILDECIEQVFRGKNVGVDEEEMGTYFIRGDNIAVIGEVDTDLQEIVTVKGENPIQPMQMH